VKLASKILAAATFVFLSLGIVLVTVYADPPMGAYAVLGIAGLCAVAALALNARQVLLLLTLKSTRNGANLAFVVFLVLGILVFANVLAKEYSFRKDVTRAAVNSLSPQTLKILKDLKQDVKVLYFQDGKEKERTEPLFKNYAYQSKHFQFEFVDTVRRPTLTAANDVKRNDTTVLSIPGTTKKVKVEGSTEEKLTNGLIKLFQTKEQAVYFTAGHGERGITAADDPLGYGTLKSELEKQGYTVKELNLVAEGKIPADAAVVVIAGARSAFYPKELELLGDWIGRGGRALLALDVDPAASGFPKGAAQAAELLKPYGISLPAELMVDPLSQAARVEPQILLGFSASKEHPVTRDFPVSAVGANFFFPLTAYVTSEEKEGITVTPLVKSSGQAWAERDWGSLKSGLVKFNEGQDKRGPLDMAVAVEKPTAPVKPGEAPAATQPRAVRLAVFGTSTFAANQVIDKAGNRDLFLNAVAWLADNEQLISIRPKEETDGLKQFNPGVLNLVLVICVFALPLAIVAAGVFVWFRRSKL
jgi:ABC-type uncharacterized transport system involved in gliding motility auxiliary subunit